MIPADKRYCTLSVILFAMLMLGGTCWYWLGAHPSIESLLKQARTQMLRGNLLVAQDAVTQVIRLDEGNAAAHFLAAEIAILEKRHAEALASLEKSAVDPQRAYQSYLKSGKLQLEQLKNLTEAERCLRLACKQNMDDIEAHEHLLKIYAVVGLEKELVLTTIHLIRAGRFTNFHLFLLSQSKSRVFSPDLLPDREQIRMDDYLARLGYARIDFLNGRFESAKTSAQKLISDSPDFVPAWLLLGEILLSTEIGQMPDWYQECPGEAKEYSQYWKITGLWQAGLRNNATAVRAFSESILRDGTDAVSLNQLAQCLEQLDAAVSSTLRIKSQQLDKYRQLVERVSSLGEESQLLETAGTAEEIGLMWEAYGWFRLCSSQYPNCRLAGEAAFRLESKFDDFGNYRLHPPGTSVLTFDYSSFPLPASGSFRGSSSDESFGANPQGVVSFRDDTKSLGLQFQYINGTPRGQEGFQRMHEFTGGGTAVLDIDQDDWPDLWFAQGGDGDSFRSRCSDQLFRNRRGLLFSNVTEESRVEELRFSQGVASGDLDHDGFPDIFVANIGLNSLHMNNGDGTFTERSDVNAMEQDSWSTSCAIADLNLDGHVDIYVVNYLAGEDVFSRVCNDTSGQKQTCRPDQFDAAQDQFLGAVGDGDFRDQTLPNGFVAPNGRGLGIIVADFEHRNRLDVFVANDGCPNHFFASPDSHPGFFSEHANARGLAINGAGRATACMGVAFGDVNGDVLGDLFITNFENETNTLYLQTSHHSYHDVTHAFSLTDPGRSTLGFGTVLSDVDNDGWQDLFMVNGHVNDQRHSGSLFQMPPLFFMNSDGQRFCHVDNSTIGPWFQAQHLGRSVAVIDWNRDGLTDFAVSNLLEDAVILTNTSRQRGRYSTLKLIGDDSPRIPVGCRTTVAIENRVVSRQVTAGDGYMASHQKCLFFGLGPSSRKSVALTIAWPKGKTQTLQMPVSGRMAVVEGRDHLYVLPESE